MSASSYATTVRMAALAQRETLYKAVIELEGALAAPGQGRVSEWTEEVIHRLRDLDAEFTAHIHVTEDPDGLYEEILELAPEHARAIELLRGEHEQIAYSIAASRVALADAIVDGGIDAEAAWIDLQRENGTAVLGRLVRHRQKGADLMWRAYQTDTGGRG
jgi:hypothetical protein